MPEWAIYASLLIQFLVGAGVFKALWKIPEILANHETRIKELETVHKVKGCYDYNN